MDVDAIYSAKQWSTKTTNKTSKKEKKTSFIDSLIEANRNKSKASDKGSNRLRTKITMTINGDTVMLFIRGDKVVRAVKLGAFDDILKMPILDTETDVGDGSLNVASLFNDSNTAEKEEITTKIITDENGDKVLQFMQGDEVIKTIKLDSNAEFLGDVTNAQKQQFLENSNIEINSFSNAKV